MVATWSITVVVVVVVVVVQTTAMVQLAAAAMMLQPLCLAASGAPPQARDAGILYEIWHTGELIWAPNHP